MSIRKPAQESVRNCRHAFVALAVTFFIASHGEAAVFVTGGDPPAPVSPIIFTADAGPVGTAGTGARGIDDLRELRQTFKNPTTFDVGQIYLGFDVTSGLGGLTVAIYEVEDVNAGTWTPGNLVHSFQYFDLLPGTSGRLKFNLTGTDVFSLPARNTGAQGYGIALSNTDGAGNPGQIIHTSSGGEDPDLYLDGRYYTELGGGNANRDFGVWLLGPEAGLPEPGDVDGLNGVDLADLAIIAANFRQSGPRSEGDLTGNGFIDLFDFREWKANYPGANSGLGFGGLTGFVPEPASGVVAMLGLLSAAFLRRRTAR
jgi:hypothetical protein